MQPQCGDLTPVGRLPPRAQPASHHGSVPRLALTAAHLFATHRPNWNLMQFLINQLFPSKSSSYKNANAVAKEVTEHYDRGNGFFDSFLGETMVRRMPHMQPRPCVLAPSAARSRSCQERSVWAAALQGVPTLPPSPCPGGVPTRPQLVLRCLPRVAADLHVGRLPRHRPVARAGAEEQAQHYLREAAPVQARYASPRHRLRLGHPVALFGQGAWHQVRRCHAEQAGRQVVP